MNIVKTKDDIYDFDQIDCGDVFEFEDNLYMSVGTEQGCEHTDYNAVSLHDGVLVKFQNSDVVKLVDEKCTLVVGRKIEEGEL